MALTTEGRLLLSYAVQVADLLEEASERLQRSDLEPGGGFQFGAVDAAVIYLLPQILKEYMRRYPGVALKTQVAPSRALVEDLLLNRSEFALIHLPYTHPKIDAVPIYRDEMPLVVGAGASLRPVRRSRSRRGDKRTADPLSRRLGLAQGRR